MLRNVTDMEQRPRCGRSHEKWSEGTVGIASWNFTTVHCGQSLQRCVLVVRQSIMHLTAVVGWSSNFLRLTADETAVVLGFTVTPTRQHCIRIHKYVTPSSPSICFGTMDNKSLCFTWLTGTYAVFWTLVNLLGPGVKRSRFRFQGALRSMDTGCQYGQYGELCFYCQPA